MGAGHVWACFNQVKVYNIKTGSHPICHSGVSDTNGNWALSTAIHNMGYTVHTPMACMLWSSPVTQTGFMHTVTGDHARIMHDYLL